MAAETDIDLAVNDLGPLAWVLDELRKSLETASAALRRFVRDFDQARGSDLASVDTGQLRIARQQLHQAVGALEMVGLAAPAHILRSMESAALKFVERPELCNEASAAKLERAGFALTEYLEGVLSGKTVSPVALFPQYRDVQELAGAERAHPADLWPLDWRWVDPEFPITQEPAAYDASTRSRLDQSVLKVVKAADAQAANALMLVSLGLAAGQSARQPRIFWKICAAYFEAVALGLLPDDLYVKRAASRILMQYATLAKGELGVSDRLAQDLLFFCAQAIPVRASDAPALAAVRAAWRLERFKPVDYMTAQYGRFDPLLLSQARKRIVAAKDTWSGLSGGDVNKLKGVADQFNLVCDSLVKLHPQSAPLSKALHDVMETVVRSARPPSTELAMEVATAILYLEAAFEDLDPSDAQLAARTARLAERLEHVRGGGESEALESWMEDLYRRVSDRQTMGSVVGELRSTLGELEKLLDQFFRDPNDKASLRGAPALMLQMRGVLSVLGLDQASQAVLRMREAVEEILVDELDVEKARAAGTFDKLGNNLGALGFLIDMLNYQPALAKKLFVYDDTLGELKPLMGRAKAEAVVEDEPAEDAGQPFTAPAAAAPMAPASAAAVPEFSLDFDMPAATPAPAAAVPPPPAPVAAAPAAPAEPDIEEDDLRDIFLEEAREVVQTGQAAIAALAANPGDIGEMTTLRRAFHTLKGSSRMVGLTEFGEAAWSLEQLLNAWLADQKPVSEELRNLSDEAMRAFGQWTEDIAAGADARWKASVFRVSADALRTEKRVVPLVWPAEQAAQPPAEPAPVEMAEAPPEVLAELPQEPAPALEPVAVEVPAPAFSLPELSLPVAEPAPPTPVAELAPLPEPEPAPTPVPEPTPAPAVDPFSLDLSEIELEVAEMPPPRSDAAADFDFDLSPPEAPAPAASTPALDTAAEIESIDFASLSAVSGLSASAPAPAVAPPVSAFADLDFLPADLNLDLPAPAVAQASVPTPEPEPVAAAAPVAAPEPEPVPEPAADEQTKVIGTLRIGIPLYNVYLNEADEKSRQLATEVAEWALELNQPVTDSMVGLAHSLAGSSATVGFMALSELARSLESALMRAQPQSRGLPEQARAFTAAAEEIRRLLHLFAAGFLKEPVAHVMGALNELKDLEIPEALFEPPAPPEVVVADPDAPEPFDVPDFSLTAALAGAAVTDKPLPAPTPAPAVLTPVPEPEPEPAPAPAMVETLPAEPVAPPVVAAPQVVEAPPEVVAPPVAFAPPVVEPPTPVIEAPVVAPVPTAAAVTARAAAAAFDAIEDENVDIDIEDAVDVDLFPIFEEEALELMPVLGSALRQWAGQPTNRSARDEVLRALHTLKGSARLAGALRLGEMAHRMESEIEQFGSDATLQASMLEPLLHRFDGMQATFDVLRATGGLPPAPPAAAPEAPAAAVASAAAPVSAEPGAAPPAGPAATRTMVAMPAATSMAPLRPASNQAVRVRSQLLDRLVTQAGEVMITRSRLEAELSQLRSSLGDLTGNLDRLRQQLRDIELQAESQMQSRLAQAKDTAAGFDPLEFDRFTRVQELTRMMAESVNDVATVQRNIQRAVEATEDDLIAQARQTRELQRDLLRTRMVEFEGISDRLYRVVRQAGKDAGKQVKLDITGGSIEMDRGVLDRMTPAFEHLLRNCVAHGVEAPDVRVQAGKDASGTIVIDLRQEGNDVSVEFRDDGAGLNLARIREKAVAQGMIAPDHTLTDAEAANMIFMPGFSTATQVTELAGRGIGMDVVRAEVNALGGRIETTTQAGKGTSFKLVLPLTTAVTQVVMIRSGHLSIGVPANLVEIVRRAPAKEVELAYNSGTYEFGGEVLPFFWSGALLQASARSVEPPAKTMPMVIFRSAAQRIAVHVDEVLGNQEVVVKNLGPQLARLPGLAGMTVLASGAVVLIYNPVALSTVYADQARALSADHAQPEVLEQTAAAPVDGAAPAVASTPRPAAPVVAAPPQIPLVLVVDDSITVRRVTQRLLQREGYRVALAADGLQAIERLAEERPTVVLSDIEMPRMDGFDLARNIRGDARLAGLPIIMITSRIAEKHREHAQELGVNNYLGKPYSEEELLSLVRHYCSLAAAETATA